MDVNVNVNVNVSIESSQEKELKYYKKLEASKALYRAVDEDNLEKINEAVANGNYIDFLNPEQLPGWEK